MKNANRLLNCLGLRIEPDGFFKINNHIEECDFDWYQIKNSPLGYKYENKRILHFTNLEAARQIIDSGFLKGSNFNRFNDEYEIVSLFGSINNEFLHSWSELKENIFAISFTEKISAQVFENYDYHWREYASKGKGIALEFRINNKFPVYQDYWLKINYTDLLNFKLQGCCEEISKLNFSEVEKEFLLPLLACFKSTDYSQESEIRFFSQISKSQICAINDNNESPIKFSISEDNKIHLWLQMPFSTPNKNVPENYLTLEKLYIGNKYYNPQDEESSSLIIGLFRKIAEREGLELAYN